LSNPMLYKKLIQDDLKAVEEVMRSLPSHPHEDLQNALEIILSAGGKRIRPVITLLVGKMLSAPRDQLVMLAASIEMLHTATLVHDDLIDGALLRRGLPTLNTKWAPGATVLTGDFMFARAAELAANTDSIPTMKLFAQTLGEIVNGEITQFFSSKCNLDRANYFQRIYKKTASLFRTCCCSAALISPVDEATVSAMCEFGHEIGMAFQIMDDILDFTAEQKILGKPVANDLRSGLLTLPAILYFETRPDDPDAKFFLDGKCDTFEFLNRIDAIVESIKNSSAIERSLQEAQVFVDYALELIADYPDSQEREALVEITSYIVQREI
jgi:geranylgeranyl pyrophosphate synthase